MIHTDEKLVKLRRGGGAYPRQDNLSAALYDYSHITGGAA